MKYKCKYCGKEFDSKQSLAGHSSHCKLNPNYESNLKILEKARSKVKIRKTSCEFTHKNELCECHYCGRLYKLYGLKNHENYCDLNPNKKEHTEKYFQRKTGSGWNKGLTKEIDERVKKSSETQKKNYKEGLWQNWNTGKTKENDEVVKRIAESNSKYMKEKHKKGEAFYWGKYGRVSYPEHYFMEVFEINEFPTYEYNYHELTYYLDFAWLQSKKYIEIDGEQHKNQIEHDIKRDKELKELGWQCIRVDWIKFIKLDENDRQIFINNLKQFIID